MKHLYVEKISQVYGQALGEKEIEEWLENPLMVIQQCADGEGQAQATEYRRDFRKSQQLKDLACFVIASPLQDRTVTLNFSDAVQPEVTAEEKRKLELEIKHLKENTVLGNVDREGLLSTVMAYTLDDAERGLEVFMREKATQATESAIIFLGHGGKSEGMGTMEFLEENPVKNEELIKAVQEYGSENTAYSVILAQCHSHVGIDEVRKGNQSGLEVSPLASAERPETTTIINFAAWYLDGNVIQRLEDEAAVVADLYPTGNVQFAMESARRPLLVNFLDWKFGPTGEKLRMEVPMDESYSESMEVSSQ